MMQTEILGSVLTSMDMSGLADELVAFTPLSMLRLIESIMIRGWILYPGWNFIFKFQLNFNI